MAASLVATTVIVAVGSNEANKLVRGQGIEIQPVIGGFILGLFLFALMAVNAPLATKFCILIIITAVLVNGKPMFTVLSKLLSNTPDLTKKKSS